MWFATWDGINKFNGYVFRTYKAKFDNRINLTNNRADHMYEDKYGFLWLQTYDNQVYRRQGVAMRFCMAAFGE